MKQLPVIIAAFAFAISLSAGLQAKEVPPLRGHVNDTAGMLSSDTIRQIELKLTEHEKATSNQVVVLTVPSLEGEILEEYSVRVAHEWKLGQKDRDNGILLFISRDDRKIRIEVGYGLEGILPDAVCSRIIRNEIKPSFKKGDFDAGVKAGTDAILGTIKGEYTAAPSETRSESNSFWPLLFTAAFIPGIIIFLILLIIIGIVYSVRKNRTYGSYSSGWSSSDYSDSSSYSSSDSYSSSSSDSGYSGGGGDFGGGGSSDSW